MLKLSSEALAIVPPNTAYEIIQNIYRRKQNQKSEQESSDLDPQGHPVIGLPQYLRPKSDSLTSVLYIFIYFKYYVGDYRYTV